MSPPRGICGLRPAIPLFCLKIHHDRVFGTHRVLKVVTRPTQQHTYNLTVTATGLSPLNADTLMGLSVSVNGATLSQSLSFRRRTSGYMFP